MLESVDRLKENVPPLLRGAGGIPVFCGINHRIPVLLRRGDVNNDIL